MAGDPRFLAIEIGGTKLQAAVGTATGDFLARASDHAPAARGAEAILEWFVDRVPKLILEATSEGNAIRAITVGFGGPIESATGRVLASHQVEGWSGFPLREWFEERFQLPTRVSNDANAAGWGEYRLGTGQGTRHFCYMNVGSGIGGALIIDGRLHDGQGLGAFEIGHTYVPTPDGEPRAAKLESLSSGWSIERQVRETGRIEKGTPLWESCQGDATRVTCAMLGEACAAGDAYAAFVIDNAARNLGLGVANAITLFHPERFAVGGGVGMLGDVLLDPLRRYVDAFVFEPYRGSFEIVPAALGQDVVLVGALLLAGEA